MGYCNSAWIGDVGTEVTVLAFLEIWGILWANVLGRKEGIGSMQRLLYLGYICFPT